VGAPQRWRELAYALLGSILDWLLSLAMFLWLTAAVCEIASAFLPGFAPFSRFSAMPGGIVASIIGWQPTGNGDFTFAPQQWALAADAAVGLAGLAVFIPLTSWCAQAQIGLTRLFLAPTLADVERRLAQVEAAKAQAGQAESAALKRIERDLHDGPQQKLIRLGFDVASLQRRLDAGDVEAAKHLADDVKARAEETLAEIRSLSRGFAPPVLAEKGLAEAVIALAATTPVPTTVTCDLTGEHLPDQVERAIYFAVSEALSNTTKHAGATSAQVIITQSDTAVIADVTDDGAGGAAIEPGHGLAGLADRVASVDGTLTVTSPPGGGTTIGVTIPLDTRQP
jgi:signal transduction histidine kinase